MRRGLKGIARSLAILLAACGVDGAPDAAGPGSAAPPTPAPSPNAEPEGRGTIRGRITLQGAPPEMPTLDQTSDPACPEKRAAPYVRVGAAGGLRDVVVRLPDAVVANAPVQGTVTLDQQACRYEPYVVGAVVGQTLQVLNSDETLHNVNARHARHAIFNRAQPAGAPAVTLALDEAGVLALRCDVHPSMLAHVFVGKHRYFAVSGPQGRFRIENVPAGTYALLAWHPHLGELSAAVRVGADAELEVDFAFDAARYEEPRR